MVEQTPLLRLHDQDISSLPISEMDFVDTFKHHLTMAKNLSDDRIIEWLQNSRFYYVTFLRGYKLVPELIIALIERWRPKTHTFHMPYGKLTITLEDVVMLIGVPVNGESLNRTVRVLFFGHFLGQTNRLMRLMNTKFPELGLQRSDCLEMSWVESTVYMADFRNETFIDVLLDRVRVNRSFSKTKSDYYKAVITKQGLETLWKVMMDIGDIMVQMNPYGGRMKEISKSEIAFAHRGGNLLMVQYMVLWSESKGGIDAAARHVELSRMLYRAMAPYASSNPREAFLNYRDLDVGCEESNKTDFEIAKEYGTKYFGNNFLRLAGVKAMIDLENFFKNEQSIPPLPMRATQ